MKKILAVTGGAGFVGSNLIEFLLKKTNLNIISIDNYSTGKKNNQINNSRVSYIKGNTKDISRILNRYKKTFTHYFILVNFLEYTKALKSFMNVLSQTQLVARKFLNFA